MSEEFLKKVVDNQGEIHTPFWVISDTHFGHNNIIKYCNRPEDHDRLMFQGWRETVGHRDVILHMGDVLLRKTEFAERIRKLPGQKFLLKGNHDRLGKNFYKEMGFTFIQEFSINHKGYKVHFTHKPLEELVEDKVINVHGHIHQKLMGDRRFLNLSVEQTNYKPVAIIEVLNERIQELNRKLSEKYL
jgi:calcineurin-like phosphoesterase family protein